MKNLKLLNIYVSALYSVAAEKKAVAKVEECLKIMDAVIRENPDFKDFIVSSAMSPSAKKNIIVNIFGKDFPDFVMFYFSMLIDKSRYKLFPDLYEYWIRLVHKKENIKKVFITFCNEPDKALKEKVEAYIKRLDPQGKHEIEYNVDPSLMGGFTAKVANIIYDNSISGRVKSLRKCLFSE